jgi:hypothetical protein
MLTTSNYKKRDKRKKRKKLIMTTEEKNQEIEVPEEEPKESAGKIKIICQYCGKGFWVYKSRGDRKYCSQNCFRLARRTYTKKSPKKKTEDKKQG